jgi:hypothetical protein
VVRAEPVTDTCGTHPIVSSNAVGWADGDDRIRYADQLTV